MQVDGIVVQTTAHVEQCSVCGAEVFKGKELQAAEQEAAVQVLMNLQETVSGRAIRFARKSLGLRQADFAELFGLRMETISRWENQENVEHVPRLAVAAMVQLHSAGPLRLAG